MTDDGPGTPRRDAAQNAELALLLEVAGTPKPATMKKVKQR